MPAAPLETGHSTCVPRLSPSAPSPPLPRVLGLTCPPLVAEPNRRGHSHTGRDSTHSVTAPSPSSLPTCDRAEHTRAERAKSKPWPLGALAPGEACHLSPSRQALPPETCPQSHSCEGPEQGPGPHPSDNEGRALSRPHFRASESSKPSCPPSPGLSASWGGGAHPGPTVASRSPPLPLQALPPSTQASQKPQSPPPPSHRPGPWTEWKGHGTGQTWPPAPAPPSPGRALIRAVLSLSLTSPQFPHLQNEHEVTIKL